MVCVAEGTSDTSVFLVWVTVDEEIFPFQSRRSARGVSDAPIFRTGVRRRSLVPVVVLLRLQGVTGGTSKHDAIRLHRSGEGEGPLIVTEVEGR